MGGREAEAQKGFEARAATHPQQIRGYATIHGAFLPKGCEGRKHTLATCLVTCTDAGLKAGFGGINGEDESLRRPA